MTRGKTSVETKEDCESGMSRTDRSTGRSPKSKGHSCYCIVISVLWIIVTIDWTILIGLTLAGDLLVSDPRPLAPALPMSENHTAFLDCGRTFVGELREARGYTTNSQKYESLPWQAAIGYFRGMEGPWVRNRGGYPFLCSGSLINERYVLTTANCITNRWFPSWIFVRLGEYDYDERNEAFKHEDYAIDRIIVHEKFSWKGFNDIALLRLAKPVTFRENIAPVCLQEADDTTPNGTALHSGWTTDVGEPSDVYHREPRKINVTLVDRDVCRKNVDRVRETPCNFQEPDFLCSVPISGVECTCDGDAGSPLFVSRDGRAQLIGMYSFGQSCLAKDPAVYVRIASHFEWITKHISE